MKFVVVSVCMNMCTWLLFEYVANTIHLIFFGKFVYSND
jgi:hypothetical protein